MEKYYIEIAPNFGNQGGYEEESDITSPEFSTPEEALNWFEGVWFQNRKKYACQLCAYNKDTGDWRVIQHL